MRLPIVFMYSGQGSQYYQMGMNLFENNARFKTILKSADEQYEALTHTSILADLYAATHKKSDIFSAILKTHPAIFLIEYALSQLLETYELSPAFVLGSSMGEFAAALRAGIIDFETALMLVVSQAKSLNEHAKPGGMLAILGPPALYQEPFLCEHSTWVGVNFPTHFVVAGTQVELQSIIEKLTARNITSQLLPVDFAFHSPLIDTAQAPFLETIKNVALHKSHLPFISCLNGEVIEELSLNHWWDIIRYPILFEQAISRLETRGPFLYLDLGPAGTLATFVKYNLAPHSHSRYLSILTPYGQDQKNFENLLVSVT